MCSVHLRGIAGRQVSAAADSRGSCGRGCHTVQVHGIHLGKETQKHRQTHMQRNGWCFIFSFSCFPLGGAHTHTHTNPRSKAQGVGALAGVLGSGGNVDKHQRLGVSSQGGGQQLGQLGVAVGDVDALGGCGETRGHNSHSHRAPRRSNPHLQ